MTYLQMLLLSIERCLVVSSNGPSKLDGVHAMKILQALLENMDCSAFLDQIVGKLLAEVHVATGKTGLKRAPSNYISSLF